MKPLHDIIIHTYAGVQLRQACFELILEQDIRTRWWLEITQPQSSLRLIIHTVGPKIVDQLTQIR